MEQQAPQHVFGGDTGSQVPGAATHFYNHTDPREKPPNQTHLIPLAERPYVDLGLLEKRRLSAQDPLPPLPPQERETGLRAGQRCAETRTCCDEAAGRSEGWGQVPQSLWDSCGDSRCSKGAAGGAEILGKWAGGQGGTVRKPLCLRPGRKQHQGLSWTRAPPLCTENRASSSHQTTQRLCTGPHPRALGSSGP